MTYKEAADIIASYEINGCGYCHEGGDEVEEAFKIAIEVLGRGKFIPRKLTLNEVKNTKEPVFIELLPLYDSDSSIYSYGILSMVNDRIIKFVMDNWNARDEKIFKVYGCELEVSEYNISWTCWASNPYE